MACHLIFTADAKGVQTRAKSPITYLQEKGSVLQQHLAQSLLPVRGEAQLINQSTRIA
jgi:hypothetical protein